MLILMKIAKQILVIQKLPHVQTVSLSFTRIGRHVVMTSVILRFKELSDVWRYRFESEKTYLQIVHLKSLCRYET